MKVSTPHGRRLTVFDWWKSPLTYLIWFFFSLISLIEIIVPGRNNTISIRVSVWRPSTFSTAFETNFFVRLVFASLLKFVRSTPKYAKSLFVFLLKSWFPWNYACGLAPLFLSDHLGRSECSTQVDKRPPWILWGQVRIVHLLSVMKLHPAQRRRTLSSCALTVAPDHTSDLLPLLLFRHRITTTRCNS